MIMRTVALPQITDCLPYLIEAERAVDALSDDELDEFERQLEASIQKLVAPPATLKLVTDTPAATNKLKSKPKKTNVFWPAFSGLLVAAIALFFVQVQKQSESIPQWETKGTSVSTSTSSACQVSLHEQNFGSPDRTDEGYLVQKSAKVFMKTNCAQNVTVQTKVAGQWQAPVALKGEAENLDGKDNYFDLSSFVGKEVRIKSGDGLNEEFKLDIKR